MEMAVSAEITTSGPEHSDGTAQKFGTQLGGIVQPQFDAAFQARPYRQDAGFAQDVQRRKHPPAQHRNNAAQNAAFDLVGGGTMQ